jgi:hypothetical protein
MRQNRVLATGENSRHPLALGTEEPVTHREHPLVNSVQTASRHPLTRNLLADTQCP